MSRRIQVADLTQLQAERYRVVCDGALQIAVYYHDGGVYAFEDRCTHNPCPLSGGPMVGDEIVCVMHGARFNIKTGAVTMPPARCDLKTFPVEVEGGEVWLLLED